MPAPRPMRRLPVLEARRREMELCVYCPKLCRSACPVSNAEPRETIIPWGKMSMAFFAARGDVPVDPSHAAPAWACTGCMACREACDHRNDVAGTLFDARGALGSAGAAPPAATRALAGFAAHRQDTARAASEITAGGAGATLLVGCAYLRRLPDVARDAVRVAEALLGPVRVASDCCGLPLLYAGNAEAFRDHARRFARSLEGGAVVVDPGCAMALRAHYPAHGVSVPGPVRLLVEEAAARVTTIRTEAHHTPVRYHDPCQLGRGLGVYDAPRAALTRALGAPPGELRDRRERAPCSGAGGLLPLTMPDTSRAIAEERLRAHEAAGGGEVVTACASSVVRLRSLGAAVTNLWTILARRV